MDTKEKPQEQDSSRAIAPDTGSPELLEVIAETTGEIAEGKPASTPLQDSLQRLRKDARAMISVGVILFFVVIALAGPPIYQHIGGIYNSPTTGKIGPERYHSFDHQELSRQDEGPSAQYWLGTDALGRDLLARLMQGMLISLAVALVVEMVDVVFGVLRMAMHVSCLSRSAWHSPHGP